MFGNNFKYVLALGFLASFVYTSPAVLDSISSGMANTNEQAAIWDSWFSFGNHEQAPSQVIQGIGSTSGSGDFVHPSHPPFGTSTYTMRPPFASSTYSLGNKEQNNQGARLNPQ